MITYEKLAEMETIARDIANIHYKVDVTRLIAEVRRLQALETAVKELRAMDDAWLRRHPRYRRPKNLVLPHDKLYALLDATAQTSTSR